MELARLWRIARGGWVVLLVAAVVGGGAGLVTARMTTPLYTAATELYVTVGGGGTAIDLLQGGSAAEQKVQSYVTVATSTRVLQPVIDDLRLDVSPGRLARSVAASTPVQSVLIDISVEYPDARLSAEIANSIGAQLTRVVTHDLEPAGGASSTPVGLNTVTPATVPANPSTPRTPVNVGLGAVTGLLVGTLILGIRSISDARLRTPEDLTGVVGAPLLGATRAIRRRQSGSIVADVEPQGVPAEEYRRLRTHLQFVTVGGRPRTFVITSAAAREGKSTTACNLAVSLAETGASVALVDADLRRPQAAGLMRVEGASGLAQVLTGRVDLADVLQPWGSDRLFVLPSGMPPPNPAELLASAAMRALVSDLGDRFDVVIIDAPPLLPVADAALVATSASGAILVAAMRRTTRKQITDAHRALEITGSPCLGLIATMGPSPSVRCLREGLLGAPPTSRRFRSAVKAYHVAERRPGRRRRGTMTAPPSAVRVLFVCSANLCRSPLAEASARHHAESSLIVGSAGLGARPGLPAPDEIVAAAAHIGIPMPAHRSRPITPELCAQADVLLTMTRAQRRDLVRLFPSATRRVFTLLEFARALEPGDMASECPIRRATPRPGTALEIVAWAASRRGTTSSRGFESRDDVTDPSGGTSAAFDRTARDIDDAVRRIARGLLAGDPDLPGTAGRPGRLAPDRSTRHEGGSTP